MFRPVFQTLFCGKSYINNSNNNVSTYLLQTYVASSDKEFAAATIQAIGRCATTISEITDACLNGLVNLLSNRNGLYTFYLSINFDRYHIGIFSISVLFHASSVF